MEASTSKNKEDNKSIEVIPGRLYWISDKNPPKSKTHAFYFCIDNDLVYEPFFADFGPLDLGKVHLFCKELEKLINDQQYSTYKIYHYTSLDYAKQANAAFLMGAFMIIILERSAADAWKVFAPYHNKFTPFRDATMGTCTYKCTIEHCLNGLHLAIKLCWYDYKTFDVVEYQHYEKVENGDLNWTVPGKFISFSGPLNQTDKYGSFTPDDYVPIFKKMGVTLVVRLNKAQYDKKKFTKAGIKHLDLYFLDGSTPPDNIVEQFLQACEAEKGAIAVHCKAGLGRTGSLIALYVMKHVGFPPADFIGWIRIARPGSILGPQQQYLCNMDETMMKMGGAAKRQELIKAFGDLSIS
jgi:cell division cycle 14